MSCLKKNETILIIKKKVNVLSFSYQAVSVDGLTESVVLIQL